MAIENDDLLYVYDTSEGEGKKIKYETLKSGTGGTGEFGYWDRTGTTLSPVNAGDSVGIGTSSADKSLHIQTPSTVTAAIRLTGDGGANGYMDVFHAPDRSGLWSPGVLPLTFATDSVERCRIDGSGNVLIGGTLPASPNITLNASGSATFAGSITQTNWDNDGTPGSIIKKGASVGNVFVKGNGSTDAALGVMKDGSKEQNFVARINADGSATFAKTLSWDGAGQTKGGATNNSIVQFGVPKGNSAGIRMYSDTTLGDAGITVEIASSDGSATFAGNVGVGGRDTTSASGVGVSVQAAGFVGAQVPSTAADNTYMFRATRGRVGGGGATEGDKFTVFANGSASFAGKVTSASTEASDPDTTLVTKDYVDANAGGGEFVFAILRRYRGGQDENAWTIGYNEEVTMNSSNTYLVPCGGNELIGSNSNYEVPPSQGFVNIKVGTWRCLGVAKGNQGSPTRTWDPTLWQRIS